MIRNARMMNGQVQGQMPGQMPNQMMGQAPGHVPPHAAAAAAAPPAGPQTNLPQPMVNLKPSDFTLPHSLDEYVPEIEELRKLQEAEKKIDAFAIRKWMDLREAKQTAGKTNGVLRVFVYNTCENQTWQKDAKRAKGEPVDDTAPASWTLRVEGRLLNDTESLTSEKRKQFSDYISSIAIDLDSSAEFDFLDEKNHNSANKSIVEWHAASGRPGDAFDGIDVVRKGFEKVKCTITLQPKEYPVTCQLAPPLAELLGVKEMSERDVIFSIWQYIQINKLQDKNNKRLIICDENLERIFGYKSVSFVDMLTLIRKQFKPVEPIKIEYEVLTDRASTLGDTVVDISVTLHEDAETQNKNFALQKEIFFENEAVIKKLDAKIALDIQALNQSRTRLEFFKKFSEDPITFMDKWMESHSKSLKILTSDEGYNEELARRSEFYSDELLDENVELLLNNGRF